MSARDRLRAFPPRLLLAAALGLLPSPTQASAGPLPPEIRERLEALYTAGAEASEGGDPATAAASYAEVLEILPEEEGSHGGRALALSDAVGAYRSAFEASPEGGQLCAALALIEVYRQGLEETYGESSSTMDGGKLAAELGGEIAELVAAEGVLCEPDSPESEPEPALDPEPEPELRTGLDPGGAPPTDAPGRGPSVWVIGGGVGLGLGGVLLGVMAGGLAIGAGASRDAGVLRDEMPGLTVDDPALDEVLSRGVRGNRLAWGAGVGAGVALISGAVLLGIGLHTTRGGSRSAGIGAGRLRLGRGLEIRF